MITSQSEKMRACACAAPDNRNYPIKAIIPDRVWFEQLLRVTELYHAIN